MPEAHIPVPIAEAIAFWQATMKRDGKDRRKVLRAAAADLFQQLEVDATVHPETHPEARKAVSAALAGLAEGIPADEARIILEKAQQGDADAGDNDADKEGKPKEPKQADILVAEAKSAKLFHTPDGEEFADIIIDGRRETHRIRGSKFRQWLRHQYFLHIGKGCNSEALQVAVETLACCAQFEGDELEVHCRIAERNGSIFLDIGDETWRAIEVTGTGWKIVDTPDVRFHRSRSTRALPMPVKGGSITALREFANLKKIDKGDGSKEDAEFVVLVGHILAAMRPNASYPVLALLGEHGSCKSTLSTIIGRLIDPRSPEQRSPPKTEEDLIVAATGAHVLAYDNISTLPDWLSDAFCRLSTGGGAGKRRLYSDSDEILFHGRRPIFLTGIEDYPQRQDLVDRCNIFGLETVEEDKRLSDAELGKKFAKAAPVILGALLDGLVAGLRNLHHVKVTDKPRMAEFMLWAEACTRNYWPAGTFIEAYRKSQAASVELVIDASTVASAVLRLMEGRKDEWRGTATELLEKLTAIVGERATKDREWPKRANALSGKLRRVAPALRKVGVFVTFPRAGHAGVRVISITARGKPEGEGKTSSAPSASSASGEKPSNINPVVNNHADDEGPDADDQWPDADDEMADDALTTLTMAPSTIVSDKSLKSKAADDAVNADDVFPYQSGGARNGNGAGDGLCIQCGDVIGAGGREITIRSTGTGQLATVHEDCFDQWQRRGPPQ